MYWRFEFWPRGDLREFDAGRREARRAPRLLGGEGPAGYQRFPVRNSSRTSSSNGDLTPVCLRNLWFESRLAMVREPVEAYSTCGSRALLPGFESL